jgi:hypothetical protein
MLRKDFFKEEDGGPLSAEMVIMIAAVGVLLGVGVSVLFNAMSDYFALWAGFFSGGG